MRFRAKKPKVLTSKKVAAPRSRRKGATKEIPEDPIGLFRDDEEDRTLVHYDLPHSDAVSSTQSGPSFHDTRTISVDQPEDLYKELCTVRARVCSSLLSPAPCLMI